MFRTCRLFFPVRNNYNVSLFNQRTCQAKQTSMEFSFYTEQRRENYRQKTLQEKVKSEFSTFKEHEKIEPERAQQKKSKENLTSDYLTFKQNKLARKEDSLSKESTEKINIDFSTFKENLSKPVVLSNDMMSNADGPEISKNDANPSLKGSRSETSIQPQKALAVQNQKNLTNHDVIKGLKVLAKTGKRATSTLNLLSQVLITSNSKFNLVECSDVLFSSAKLTFANLPLLDLISENVLRELSAESNPSPKVLVSLLQSVCKLKYRNCELIEGLCKQISNLDPPVATDQISLCLFALTSVNLKSPHVDNFINVLTKLKNTDFNKTKSFLNYVWACIILEKQDSLPMEHLELVLSKSFVEQLTISGENNLLSKIKLSNISGVASSLKEYKGPLLDNLIFSPVLSKSKNDFLGTVRDSLSYIFPKLGFIQALSYAGSGVFIDIECCLDSSSNPVQLKTKEKKHKVGIVLLDHNDFCLGDSVMTGVNAFKVARIKSRGYKVVTLSHTEFPFDNALSEKIAYLRKKLKEVLA